MAGLLIKSSSMQRVVAGKGRNQALICRADQEQRPGGRGRVAAFAEPAIAERPTIQTLDRPGGRGRNAGFEPAGPQEVGTISVDRPGGRGRLFTPEVSIRDVNPIIVDRPGGRSNRLAFGSGDGNNGNGGGSGGFGGNGDWSRWPLFASVYATVCAGAFVIHNQIAGSTPASSPQPAT